MSWTPPATASVGTLETAALWNTNVRDNLLWLSSPDRVRATMGNSQSIPDSTVTAVTWTSADTYDTNSMHSTSSNPSRITIKTSGLYAVAVNIWFAANATGYRQLWLYKNGSALGLYVQNPSPGTGACNANLYDEIQCVAGDYLEARAEQNSGAALNINTTSGDASYMSVRWVATS